MKEIIINNIRKTRKEKNVNQSVIADVMGISVQGYSMKERGLRPITLDELEIIANVLGVSMLFFLNTNST